MRDKATAEADALKIGILGGSYDPPHFGHLAIAKAALRELRLDEVLFLPNNRNPFKPVERAAGAEHRMAMVKLLIADEGSMAVSDIEITRGGISYTVDTLAELQMAQPAHYWFILGSDALKSFDTWKSPTRILKMCRLAVINREPSRSFSLPKDFRKATETAWIWFPWKLLLPLQRKFASACTLTATCPNCSPPPSSAILERRICMNSE